MAPEPAASPEPASPPAPTPDHLTEIFWQMVRAHELWMQRCIACGHYLHHPKPMCRFCGGGELHWEPVSGRATLYSWTIATRSFQPYFGAKVPYTIGVVELVEQTGLMFLTQIVDCPEELLAAGMDLAVTFRALSDTVTLPFFKPVNTESLSR